MGRITYGELAGEAGTGTGNFIKRAANTAADGACTLYRDFPGFMAGANVIRSPLDAFSHGVWDSLCSGRSPGLPPPPSQEFLGGQCECEPYAVVVAQMVNGVEAFNTFFSVLGKVEGLLNEDNGTGYNAIILCSGGVGQSCVPGSRYNAFTGGSGYNVTYRIKEVVPQSEAGKLCGNAPPSYPRISPPPAALKDKRDIDFGNGHKFTLPLVYAPIKPTLQIPVNLGGLGFDFGAGGVDFNFSDGSPAGGGSGNGDGNQGLDDRFDDFKTDWDDFRNNPPPPPPSQPAPPPPPPSPIDYDEEVKQEEEKKEEDDKFGLVWVTVELTGIPSNARIQKADGDSNVYYAGHFNWRTAKGNQVRQYIHWKNNVYYNNVAATGYSVTMYGGYKCVVRTYKEKISGSI